MRIRRIELRRYRIPFREAFVHASAARSVGDAILVEVHFDGGVAGFGEIQARPYVTGEDNDRIWRERAPALAARLLGTRIEEAGDVEAALGGAEAYDDEPALVGGFDLALMDGLDTAGRVKWQATLGPTRDRPIQRCVTLGSDLSPEDLRRRGRVVRLMGPEVVKLKVTGPEDGIRCQALREAVGPDTRIRLDGNGRLTPEDALALLTGIREVGIESVEEPLPRTLPDLVSHLVEIHGRTGIPLMADESMCTAADIRRFRGTGAYQYANVRVGKCGGIAGTVRFLAEARRSGLDLVSGTMVGETPILLHFSGRLLQHCNDLDYVEGIDQAETLLVAPVVRPAAPGSDRRWDWLPETEGEFCVSRREFC